MRIRLSQLKRIIKEETASAMADAKRFLHGEDPEDSEGAMAQSKLASLAEMSGDLISLLKPDDQLPGWVQDHISVAHENLQQVHGYMMGKDSAKAGTGITLSKESRLRR